MNVSGIGGIQAGGGVHGTGAIGAATWSGASRRAGGPGAVGRMQAAIGSLAQLMSVPTSQLVSQLGTGRSLTDIATAAGVSASRVMDTVAQAVAGAVPQGAQPLSGDVLRTVAARIATSTSVPAGFRA